jgi:hypothetical protein
MFMEQAMEFERLRGNLFKVIDPNSGSVRVVEAGVLAESIANAARCYRDYRESQGAEIIAFPEVKAAH